MTEARITLNARVKPIAEELILLTGVSNISNLFSLFLTRYGSHLKNSWVLNGSVPSSMTNVSYKTSVPPGETLSQKTLEPCNAVESQVNWEISLPEDPLIARLKDLIEDF